MAYVTLDLQASLYMVMVLWFMVMVLKPYGKPWLDGVIMCLPIKLSGKHVPDRKCVAFVTTDGVKTS